MTRRLLFVLGLFGLLSACQAAAAAPPKLLVLVTVDQLPYAHLVRFGKNLDATGIFARVDREGVSFTECNFAHATTTTGPGHAVLATGAHPFVHGVINTSWYDRSSGDVINCVADDSVTIIGSSSASGASGKNLLAPTVGDALKLATQGKAKVFSIGVKARSAILSAGRLADGVFWFDTSSGNWVTSSAYADIIPGYLRQLNEANRSADFGGREWALLHPEDRYHKHRPDDDPVETPRFGFERAFPHVMPDKDDENYYSRWTTSPFCNQYVLASAASIIAGEQLGADDTPDLFCLNLSSNDYVGHAFGPYSLEVEDMFYRTDGQLGKFADELDKLVGKGEWVMAISSDHGVAPNPTYAERLGLINKVNALEAGRVQAVLEAQLSVRFGELGEGDPSYVESVRASQVYLRERHPNLAGDRFGEAQRLVRTLILAHPSVTAAMTRDEIIGGRRNTGVYGRIARSFHPDRSGDVAFAMAPYQYDRGELTASHGSPWRYDTHVPLMLIGAGVRKAVLSQPVDPSMLAPTLAKMLDIPPPAAAQSPALSGALSGAGL